MDFEARLQNVCGRPKTKKEYHQTEMDVFGLWVEKNIFEFDMTVKTFAVYYVPIC